MAQEGSSCLSCRARKVKCDRITPQCSPCKKRNLHCEIPEAPPRMRWLRPRVGVGPDEELEDLHARRRPLFAVHDLAHNAADLVFIAGNSPIVSILDELDRRTENIEDNETLCNGPFHVFQASDMQSPTRSNTGSDVLDLELWGPGLASLETLGRDEGSSPQLPRTPELLTLGDAILSSDSFDFDVDLLCPPSPGAIAQPLVSIASPSQSCGLDLEDFTMPVAKMLLDHYRNHMVTFFTPARVEAKSPWEAIYIPSLLSTVGEIGLTGDSSNAKVSLLFAVFAISAFSLDGRSPAEGNEGQDWSALGELYRDRATRRLKRSLSDLSLSQGKKEKYKDILMALLSMVTICVVSGKMRNAAHYLRDIEEIINLHGVRKVSRSSKVRMLHSIFLYLRALTKRTSIDECPVPHSSGLKDLILSSAQDFCKWDRLIGFSSSSPEAGSLNLDIALDPTPYKSMFEEIYSVPQSLFKLILQTTHVSVVVEKLQQSGRLPNVDHDAFSVEVKKLEARICTWEYGVQEDLGYSPQTPLPGREVFPYHLVQAVHKALIVYFYRCVRDVNGAILQFYVQKIIYHLLEYDKNKERHKDRSANTCWPGFIAGCEALDPQLREQIGDWLERSGRSTGIRMFTVALEAVQKVWQARNLPGMQNAPWNQILEQFSELRVLVLS